MIKYTDWKKVAKYCEDTFGVQFDEEEGFFTCCECGEPLYYDDGREEETPWVCPICGINFETGENEGEE